AVEARSRVSEPCATARTVASGLRVPAAVGDFMILDAIRASGGTAIAVDERRLKEWLRLASSLEGVPICPEAAGCVGALERLTATGWIKPQEQIVVFNTGAAQKYVEAIRCDLPRIDLKQTIDW